jgi:hypothetical protein
MVEEITRLAQELEETSRRKEVRDGGKEARQEVVY